MGVPPKCSGYLEKPSRSHSDSLMSLGVDSRQIIPLVTASSAIPHWDCKSFRRQSSSAVLFLTRRVDGHTRGAKMPLSCLYNFSILSQGNLLGQVNQSSPVLTIDHMRHAQSEVPSVARCDDKVAPTADRPYLQSSDSSNRSHGGSASGKSDWDVMEPMREAGGEKLTRCCIMGNASR